MEWNYRSQRFISKPVIWEDITFQAPPKGCVYKEYNSTLVEAYLVYYPKWDKCFWLEALNYSGNQTSRLKSYIIDVYTNKYCYVDAKNLELVYYH